MPWTTYLKRVGLMLLVAMPCGALILAASELARPGAKNLLNAFGGALVLVYIWGALTGGLASVLHTTLVRAAPSIGKAGQVIAGILLGTVAGALTPTPFTGLLEPAAVGIGATVGLVYGVLVARAQSGMLESV